MRHPALEEGQIPPPFLKDFFFLSILARNNNFLPSSYLPLFYITFFHVLVICDICHTLTTATFSPSSPSLSRMLRAWSASPQRQATVYLRDSRRLYKQVCLCRNFGGPLTGGATFLMRALEEIRGWRAGTCTGVLATCHLRVEGALAPCQHPAMAV